MLHGFEHFNAQKHSLFKLSAACTTTCQPVYICVVPATGICGWHTCVGCWTLGSAGKVELHSMLQTCWLISRCAQLGKSENLPPVVVSATTKAHIEVSTIAALVSSVRILFEGNSWLQLCVFDFCFPQWAFCLRGIHIQVNWAVLMWCKRAKKASTVQGQFATPVCLSHSVQDKMHNENGNQGVRLIDSGMRPMQKACE